MRTSVRPIIKRLFAFSPNVHEGSTLSPTCRRIALCYERLLFSLNRQEYFPRNPNVATGPYVSPDPVRSGLPSTVPLRGTPLGRPVHRARISCRSSIYHFRFFALVGLASINGPGGSATRTPLRPNIPFIESKKKGPVSGAFHSLL